MKLIKTFMAAALLSTAFAGSVMAGEDVELGGVKIKKTATVVDLNAALKVETDGDTSTLTLAHNIDFVKALVGAASFEDFTDADAKKELAALKSVYASLAKESGLVGEADAPNEEFYDELARAPAITGWDMDEIENADKKYGVDNYGAILGALSNPLDKALKAEGAAEKIAALKSAKKYPSEVTESVLARYEELEKGRKALRPDARKEEKDALAKRYEELFADLNANTFGGQSFAEHAKEHASETVSREVHLRALQAKKPAKHVASGGSFVEALAKLGSGNKLGLLGTSFKDKYKADLTTSLISSDTFDEGKFSQALLESIQAVAAKAKADAIALKKASEENVALKRQLQELRPAPVSTRALGQGHSASGHSALQQPPHVEHHASSSSYGEEVPLDGF